MPQKLREEPIEIEAALAAATARGSRRGRRLLFVVVIWRHRRRSGRGAARRNLNVGAVRRDEDALRAQWQDDGDSTLAEMDALWDQAKAAESQ